MYYITKPSATLVDNLLDKTFMTEQRNKIL